MLVEANSGRGRSIEPYKWVWRLTLTADSSDPLLYAAQGELLARIFEAVTGGDSAALLTFLRRKQIKPERRFVARAAKKAADAGARKKVAKIKKTVENTDLISS